MFAPTAESVSSSCFSQKQCETAVSSSKAVPLAYTLYEPQDAGSTKAPPIIFLDAILGVRSSWSELSQAIATQTGRNVYAVDARNHGDSPHVPDLDYALMAADVELFMRDHGLPRAAFVAHSMGGRTAMRLALTKPCLVERLVVVDVGPCSVPAIVGNYFVPQQLDAMEAALPRLSPHLSFDEAYREADRIFAGRATLENPSIRSLLLANLWRNGDSYDWKVNVKDVRKSIGGLVRAEDLKGITSPDVDALFICGGLSPYVSTAEHGAIRRAFPKARIVSVEGAGHWVHRDKPAAFLSLVKDFMAQQQ
ncbi:protein ABHD11 isoform X2 [Rhipicephalus sanguineus]|uniref:protein ABHD11 isoform X2 n=1 Tax=Rhipicephalus sanguineus TaxID=34632 RepID=UPI0020C56865|nr:protein ABHD11 isoform X2 [Rhipicephalus sanguineus]